MKKILAIVLTVLMLVPMLAMAAGAAATIDPSASGITWSDSSALKLSAPLHQNHPVIMSLGQKISENSTVTLFVKPDSATADADNSISFWLTSGYAAADISNVTLDDVTLAGVTFASVPDATAGRQGGQALNLSYGVNRDDMNTEQTIATYKQGLEYADTLLTFGEWNRIDIALDFTAKTQTVYLNYKEIGTGAFKNATLDGFSYIYIPSAWRSNAKYSYVDNLIIRKGCNAPADTDLPANLNVTNLTAEKNNVLYFDPFDASADRKITAALNAAGGLGEAGSVICKRQNFQGYVNEIVTTEGIAKPAEPTLPPSEGGSDEPDNTEDDALFTEDFSTVPSGMENVNGVSIVGNKVLKITQPGAKDAENPVPTVWGYKSYIKLSDSMITENCTVSWYMKLSEAPDGWSHPYPMVLTDELGKVADGHNLTGISNWTDEYGSVKMYGDVDGSFTTVDTTAKMTPGGRKTPGEWKRIDVQIDFTNDKAIWYFDGELLGEVKLGDLDGFKGIKSFTVSSGNFTNSMFVDEIVVRKGLIAPTATDMIAKKDRDAIEASADVLAYQPFDAVGGDTMSNSTSIGFEAVEDKTFANQSSLNIIVPRGDDAFEAKIPMGTADITGNTTVSIKFKAEYTVKTTPGLKFKLVNAENKVLGGIVVGADATLMFDDGTNVYHSKNANGEYIPFITGTWYELTMLVNHTGKSLTVYVDGVRIGSVALEGDLSGFSGLALSKCATNGTKNLTVTLDNLIVEEGLLAPDADAPLADNDARVTVDTHYVPEENKTEDNKTNDKNDDKNTEETTDAPSDEVSVDDVTDDEEKKGCGSSIAIGGIALMVAVVGTATVVRRKEN
ncbi:MAG: hypothetical protein IJZ83_03200 [Clostridia bacterium]|nr:hypothetical protein [Clostridia bacterium]